MRRRMSDEEIQKAIKLREEGWTFLRVADELKVPLTTLMRTVGSMVGGSVQWRKCNHYWGIAQGLRYPNHVKYGILRVCVRCRARRFQWFDTKETLLLPPIPLSYQAMYKKFGRRVGKSRDDEILEERESLMEESDG